MSIFNRHIASVLTCCACLLGAACSDGGNASGSGGQGGTAASGGQGGAGGGGGTGASGGSTTSGMGGMGGMLPAHPGVLVDDTLVSRYYIDEADVGMAPTELIDSASDPMNLALSYATGEMAFYENAEGNRGLQWTTAELDSGAWTQVDGSKLVGTLQTSKTATAEMVLSVQDVTSSFSRLLYTGYQGNTGRFTIGAWNRTGFNFVLNDSDAAAVLLDLVAVQRFVLHVVLDTTQTEPQDRAKIYVNGGRLPSVDPSPPDLDDGLDLGVGRYFVIGNREPAEGGRSIQGVIYYVALYGGALTDEQVLQNATLLLENDDTPTN